MVFCKIKHFLGVQESARQSTVSVREVSKYQRGNGGVYTKWVCVFIIHYTLALCRRIRATTGLFPTTQPPVPTRRKAAPVSQICGGKKIACCILRVRGGYASSTHRRCSPLDALRKGGVLVRQYRAPLVPHHRVRVQISWDEENFLRTEPDCTLEFQVAV